MLDESVWKNYHYYKFYSSYGEPSGPPLDPNSKRICNVGIDN